jgi:addiction module RelB/DinJ family antitoxin
MAAKTANVLARVEPEVKEQAEAIMSQLGVPVSVVINMLYKQIIMTRSIPFSLSVPRAPLSREEMSREEFDQMMQQGIEDAGAGRSAPATEVFAALRRELQNG